MKKCNVDIRDALREAGLFQWVVAERCGISEAKLSRMMRKEMDSNEKEKIFKVIDELKQELSQAT